MTCGSSLRYLKSVGDYPFEFPVALPAAESYPKQYDNIWQISVRAGNSRQRLPSTTTAYAVVLCALKVDKALHSVAI